MTLTDGCSVRLAAHTHLTWHHYGIWNLQAHKSAGLGRGRFVVAFTHLDAHRPSNATGGFDVPPGLCAHSRLMRNVARRSMSACEVRMHGTVSFASCAAPPCESWICEVKCGGYERPAQPVWHKDAPLSRNMNALRHGNTARSGWCITCVVTMTPEMR